MPVPLLELILYAITISGNEIIDFINKIVQHPVHKSIFIEFYDPFHRFFTVIDEVVILIEITEYQLIKQIEFLHCVPYASGKAVRI